MFNYFKSRLITYIDIPITKEEILKYLVDLIKENTNSLTDSEDFYDSIIEREKLGSTGIGLGIAIPHARSEKIKDTVVAIALLKYPIDFASPDTEKVKLVILVGAPKEENRKYLSLVAELSRTFRDETMRNNVISANNYQELLEAIAELKWK